MPILTILVVLVILGLCLYLVERFIPMAEPIKLVIRVVVVLLLIVWLLSLIGVVSPIHLR
jgi:hypothetical protein